MGSRQENWFYRSLKESKDRGAAWRIVGNQIIFSRLYEDDSGVLSGDNWNVWQDTISRPEEDGRVLIAG